MTSNQPNNDYSWIPDASTNQETIDEVNIFAMTAEILFGEPLDAENGYSIKDRAWENHEFLNT